MRDEFRGYYPLSEDELERLWTRGTIVLDTNVLLNLYKFPADAREGMFALLEAARDRIWIPHHVALEYHRRREVVIESQLNVFDKVKTILGYGSIKAELDRLQLRKFHSLISVEDVLRAIRPALEEFDAALAALESEHVKPFGADPVRDRLNELFGNDIGEAFTSQELQNLYREGTERYSCDVPPGYKDDKEKSKLPEFVHGGLTYKPSFGDLIIWKQVIRHAKDHGIQELMLVSDDEKSDWRHAQKYRGTLVLLPRPELVEEIRREAGVDVFFIYSSENFLGLGGERLGVAITDATVSQVTDVKEATRSRDDPRWSDPALSLITVEGAEGNRRDASLICGHCGVGPVAIHFYEGDGIPKLLEVLGVFHYWECPALTERKPVNVMVMPQQGDPYLVTWLPPPNMSD